MVITDVGDDGQAGQYNVCCIQTASEPCFYHSYVHLLRSEEIEGHGCCNLKERQILLFRNGVESVEKRPYLLPRYQFHPARAHQPHTLAEIEHMRRGVKSHLHPPGGQ